MMEGKKSKIDNADLVIDRISSLPDSILGHILSFLPTKEAVAASVLSKRWEFAWVTVHDLDFYFVETCEGRSQDENMKFVQFVDRVLLLHDGGSLNKFSLGWHFYTIASYVSSWINIAITRHVQELYLSLGDGEIFYIPISGFNCDSLQSLELKGISFVCDGSAVCLPRLEKLKLNRVYFESTEACGKLISGCLMLQKLYLDIYSVDNYEVEELDMPLSVFTVDSLQSLKLIGNISIPAAILVCLPRLEKLKLDHVNFESNEVCEKLIRGCPMLQYLYLGFFSFTGNGDDNDDYFTCIVSSASLRHLKIHFNKGSGLKLKLKASSLESFKVSGGISEIYVEKSLRSLAQADFSVRLDGHDFSNNSIVEAVRAFNCAEVLTLSTDVMWALSRATISLLTEFKRLVKLVARTYCSSLQDVVQSSNNLRSLIIQLPVGDVHGHSKWTTPVEVPRCLSNSLKKIQLYDYKGLEDEREMIRYMLKNGTVLEVMRISCYTEGDGEKLKLVQDISEFPRKSPVCIVQFSREPGKRRLEPLF